jgi:tRNA 2-thiocytidine biosynthesis protein TtcA
MPKPINLQKRLLSDMGRAIGDFELISEGDRIMVAVSGGKDSLALLHLLLANQKRAPVAFSLVAMNLDQRQPGYQAEVIRDHFESLNIEYYMIRRDTYSVVRRLVPDGKTMCSVCSRLRRGILYRTARKLKCNKIALGHHREDLIETLLLSALYAGSLSSMPPKLISDDGRSIVIRPLVYCAEETIRAYAIERNFPVIPCNLCDSQENRRRKRIKELIRDLTREHPAVPGNLLHALSRVVPSHLLDRKLDAALRIGDPASSKIGE